MASGGGCELDEPLIDALVPVGVQLMSTKRGSNRVARRLYIEQGSVKYYSEEA